MARINPTAVLLTSAFLLSTACSQASAEPSWAMALG